MQAEWHGMEVGDLAAVKALGDSIHRDYPERFEVLAERHRLHPAGCRVLRAAGNAVQGYVVSHPWSEVPPMLDTLLEALPTPATTYYLHDLALAAEARGTGMARRLVASLAGEMALAGFRHLSLTAVGRSHRFWRMQGFLPVAPVSAAQRAALASYGATACLLRLPL